MGIKTRIPSSSSQVFILSVWYMLTSSIIPVFLSQPKVNEEKFVAVSSNTHEKIIWFYIPMNEVFVVYILNSSNHLVSQHQHSLHRESARAEVEEVFQRRS